MPIYVYRAVSEESCNCCENGFEVLQKLSADTIDACPECGARVARAITAANLATSAPSLDEKNLGKHGFTQYRKLEKGVYEKTTGKGPKIITDKN